MDVDLDKANLELSNGEVVEYDVVSFDVGSTTRGHGVVEGSKEFTIPTRPISDLVGRISKAEENLEGDINFVGVGGGAAGIELALAMRARWGEKVERMTLTILDSNDILLGSESEACRKAIGEEMTKREIGVLQGASVERVEEGSISLKDGRTVPFTHAIWATGAACQGSLSKKLGDKGLSVDGRGWVMVSDTFESLSHPNVFAAGDCCTIVSNDFKAPPKAGVYAVRAGPILIKNLVAACSEGVDLVKYRPQGDFLKVRRSKERSQRAV